LTAERAGGGALRGLSRTLRCHGPQSAILSEACESCGLAITGGGAGCQRLFESTALREHDDMRLARYHRIVVDVYAMQHADR
jgi:hypothetical protein